MRKNTISFCLSLMLFAFAWLPMSAQTVTTPRPSLAAKVSQTVGVSTVTVCYSRPTVRNREVWGKLVPYGWNVQQFGAKNEAPWRAGANENTVIEFSHAVKVEGKSVPAGAYGLFFVINDDNTGEVILSKESKAWGSFWYDPAQDQLRMPIQIKDGPHTEMLTYDFVDANKNSAELVLSWEKKQFPVKLTFDTDDVVMTNATTELKGVRGFNWQGYSSAANYALQNKTNLEQGIKWIDQAIAQNRSYATLVIKSGIQGALGQEVEAARTKKEALALATELELNNQGYQLLAQQQNDQAIDIFKIATERFPNSPNAWDSLGEGYALKGDQKNAINCFKKSLKMNPPENVKANSQKYLTQFGVL